MSLDVVTLLLLVAFVFDWSTVVVLYRAARTERVADGRPNPAIEDRGRVATAIAIAATAALVLALGAEAKLDIQGAVAVVLPIILVIPSIANALFLLDLATGRFRQN